MWSNISHTSRAVKEQLTGETKLSSPEAKDDNNNLIGNDNKNNNNYGSPLMRYKHAVCSASNGYIYIHGGRFGNLALDDDVWRFDAHQNSWLQLQTSGCKPPSLQEHTLVEFHDHLYLFGGQVSASNTENSFWRLNLNTCEWQSLNMKSSKFGAHLGPTNRRGHSAVIRDKSMYIFGGFEDFRGSSAQLWEFNLISECWELRNLNSSSSCYPEARHSHSAVIWPDDDSMLVFGGLSNLKPLSDLWRWSWREKRWFKLRTRGKAPGQLHGHAAIQAFGSMFVFGGERNGRPTRSLWRLNLSNLNWQKIRPKGPRPSPITWHAAIANPLNILDEANYIVEGADDPDLLLKSDTTSCFYAPPTARLQQQAQQVVKLEPLDAHSSLSPPSKWSCVTADHQRTPLFAQNHQERQKRKGRLSFLRRRQMRPKSTYDLKQVSTNEQTPAIDNQLDTNSSHSKQIHKSASINSTLTESNVAVVLDTATNNVKILDNLDTDIKQMFERRDVSDEEDDCEQPMSVDNVNQLKSNSQVASQSQYLSAVQDELSAMRSQRTSYAYTTPPSELNTLRGDQPSQVAPTTTPGEREGAQSTIERLVQQGLLSSTPVKSGYNRRDNRPKSEIVQSLIDRADARIKHLYTPFFNQQQVPKRHLVRESSEQQQQQYNQQQPQQQQHRQHRNSNNRQLLLDKSKRHTIHQTMTYYSLYFSSEEKSSNSPPSSGDNSNQAAAGEQNDESFGGRLTRDELSSTTIRNLSSQTGSGNLIGVRSAISSLVDSRRRPSDSQVNSSELSLTEISSESRTLCDPDNNLSVQYTNLDNQMAQDIHSSQPATTATTPSTTTNSGSTPVGDAAALTARRDATGSESFADNTSLSFSAIAEFEEDDMLQYSSPTDPVIAYKSSKRADESVTQPQPPQSAQHQQQPYEQRYEQVNKLVANSASSGYDSVSAGARETTSGDLSADTQQQFIGSTSDTQEDSGSSLVFTSPEQSLQQRKQRNRSILQRRKHHQVAAVGASDQSHQPKQQLNQTTSSSITADSLALTSDCFSSNTTSCAPNALSSNSLPSSPATESGNEQRRQQQQQVLLSNNTATQVKRSMRFFGNKSSSSLMSSNSSNKSTNNSNRYWQLCMFVIGGKQNGVHGNNEPITIWRLYI